MAICYAKMGGENIYSTMLFSQKPYSCSFIKPDKILRIQNCHAKLDHQIIGGVTPYYENICLYGQLISVDIF